MSSGLQRQCGLIYPGFGSVLMCLCVRPVYYMTITARKSQKRLPKKKKKNYSSVVSPRMALCDSEVYVVVTDKCCVVSPELTPCPVLCRHCPALESPSAAWTRRRTRTGSRSDRVTVQQLLITMSMCYCMNESEYILFSQPCCTVTFLRLDLMCLSRAGRGSQGD